MHERPDLLRRFRKGEPEALREVYVQHVDRVDTLVRLGFFTSGPPPMKVAGVRDERRRDIVQDVFLRAFRTSARLAYDGLRPYAPYLLRIAKNVCIDRFRRERRERLHTESESYDVDALIAGHTELVMPCAEEDRDFHRQAEETQRFVERLDLEAQRFVELRFKQELSQAQVAEQLQVTRRRVRTLEDQVLSGLRRHFEKQGLSP